MMPASWIGLRFQEMRGLKARYGPVRSLQWAPVKTDVSFNCHALSLAGFNIHLTLTRSAYAYCFTQSRLLHPPLLSDAAEYAVFGAKTGTKNSIASPIWQILSAPYCHPSSLSSLPESSVSELLLRWCLHETHKMIYLVSACIDRNTGSLFEKRKHELSAVQFLCYKAWPLSVNFFDGESYILVSPFSCTCSES